MDATMTISPERLALYEEMTKTALAEINCAFGLDLEDLTEIENEERFAELMLSGVPAAEAYRRTQTRFGADDATEERPAGESDTQWVYIGMGDQSMAPRLQIGDVLFVRKQMTVNDGDVAVFMLDGEKLMVRQIFYHPDMLLLSTTNPAYEPIIIDRAERDRVRIVGRVMRLARSIDPMHFDSEWVNRICATTSAEEKQE